MRLNKKDIQSIVRVAKEIYGEGVEVYLFGSRTDNEKRGGDIDLLVRTNRSMSPPRFSLSVREPNR